MSIKRQSLNSKDCVNLLKESYNLIISFKNILTSYQLQQISNKSLIFLSEKINGKEEINNYKINKCAMIIVKPFFEAIENYPCDPEYIKHTLTMIKFLLNNNIFSQNSHLSIIKIFITIIDYNKNEYLEEIFDLMSKMINKERIQLSHQIILNFFSLCVKIINLNKEEEKYKKLFINYVDNLFNFLDVFLRPVIYKENKQLQFQSHEKLDDTITTKEIDTIKKKRNQQSFYTIQSESHESDNEIENLNNNSISNDSPLSVKLYNSTIKISLKNINEKSFLKLEEYKKFDIYKSCIKIFHYLVTVISGKSKYENLLEPPSIEISLILINTIIKRTNNLLIYIDDFFHVIDQQLVDSLYELMRDYKFISNIKSLIVDLVFLIVKNYHFSFWLIIPTISLLKKDNNRKEKLFEFIDKLINNLSLFIDIYQYKTDNCLEIIKDDSIRILEEITGTRNYLKFNNNVIGVIMNCFSHQKMKELSSIYLINIKQLYNDLEKFFLIILSQHHIYLDNPNTFSLSSRLIYNKENDYNQLREPFFFFTPYICNIFNWLFVNLLNFKEDIGKYIDSILLYLKIYSIINDEPSKEQIFKVIINLIENPSLSFQDFNYLVNNLFEFIQIKEYNESIESWRCIFNSIEKIYEKIIRIDDKFDMKNKDIIEGVENYIKHIENNITIYNRDKSKENIDINVLLYDEEENDKMNNNIETNFLEAFQELAGLASPETLFNNKSKRQSRLRFKSILSKQSTNGDSFEDNLCTLRNNSMPQLIIDEKEEKESPNFIMKNIIQKIETFLIGINEERELKNNNFISNIIMNAIWTNSFYYLKKMDLTGIQFNLIMILQIISTNAKKINHFFNKISLIVFEVFNTHEIKEENIKMFAFDTMTIVLMFIICLYEDEEGEKEENDVWKNSNYQNAILTVYEKFIEQIIFSHNINLKRRAVQNLKIILIHSGHKINKEGWEKLFNIFLFIVNNINEIGENTYKLFSCLMKYHTDNINLIGLGNKIQELMNLLLIKSKKDMKNKLEEIISKYHLEL